MRLIQAVSVILVAQVEVRANVVHRWVCIGTVTAGTSRRTLSRKGVRYSGNAILPTFSRHIASQDRMYLRPYTYVLPGRSSNQIDPPSIQTIVIRHFPLSRPGRMGRRATQSSDLSYLSSLQSKNVSCISVDLATWLNRFPGSSIWR
jgi:hypothetical protein